MKNTRPTDEDGNDMTVNVNKIIEHYLDDDTTTAMVKTLVASPDTLRNFIESLYVVNSVISQKEQDYINEINHIREKREKIARIFYDIQEQRDLVGKVISINSDSDIVLINPVKIPTNKDEKAPTFEYSAQVSVFPRID